MDNPTLVILAAGLGSRFGGLKQLEPIGPDGSSLMEYGISDAIRIRFDRVIFVVRPETKQLVADHAATRFAHKIEGGICRCSQDGVLIKITEVREIGKHKEGGRYVDTFGDEQVLSGDETVSMNMWGLLPSVFGHLEAQFREFLANHDDSADAEFYLPAAINIAIEHGFARVQVLRSPDMWCGVTYPSDKPHVARRIQELVERGDYPRQLWT